MEVNVRNRMWQGCEAGEYKEIKLFVFLSLDCLFPNIIIIIIIYVMELGHLLTRSGLTYPEVSSRICHDSFCQLGNSVSLPWVIYYKAFYLRVLLYGFFLWDLPVFKISPELVTGPEQGTSSGRIATFSLWTGMFRDGISFIPGETVIPLWLGRHYLVCGNSVYRENVRMTFGLDRLWC